MMSRYRATAADVDADHPHLRSTPDEQASLARHIAS
jgi:hypothetical protein